MSEIVAAYAAAFALGATHALEVDHMVAVSTFVGHRPQVGSATVFGVRWGLGHALVVLIVGALLAWSNIPIPGTVERWMELGVGLMLVGLGVWAVRSARRLHVHEPGRHGGHAHLHAHSPDLHPHDHAHADPTKRHRHLSTLVGAVHGLAGTAPIVALIPVTLLPGAWSAMGYLVAFGFGTVLAMGIYAALTALAAQRAASSLRAAHRIAVVTGLASVAVGVWWIVRTAPAVAL